MTKTHTFGRQYLMALVVGMAIVLITGSQAWAVLYAYEGFDYSVGGNLVGLGAADSQWTGAWANDPAPVSTGTASIDAGSLSYTDSLGNVLVTSGNKMLGSGAAGRSQQIRTMVTRVGADNTSTWISVLGRRFGETSGTAGTGGTPTYERGANFATFDTMGGTDGMTLTEKLDIGESSGIAADAWMIRQVGLAGGSGVGQRDKISTSPIDVTSLIMVRIDHHGTIGEAAGWDDVRFWVNPQLNEAPSDASAAGTNLATDGTMSDLTFNYLRTFAGELSGTQALAEWYVDEIRIGSSYADVAPFTPGAVGVLGDYNDNDVVDAADFVVWREAQIAGATTLTNRGTGINGAVGQADYDFWKGRFGNISGAGSVIGGNVPEPHSVVLLVLAFVGLGAHRSAGRRG